MAEKRLENLNLYLDKSFNKYIKEKSFPGAAIGISFCEKEENHRLIFTFGKTDESEKNVDNHTLYDVASLTKPLVTVLSLLALRKEKKINWNDKLGSLLSLDIPKDKRDITLAHLMSHSSGLPAHRPYYKSLIQIPPEQRKEEIIKLIVKEEKIFEPGTDTIYSDLGYILLGSIVEDKSGMFLDEFWREKILYPLHLQDELIFPKNGNPEKNFFASTGYNSSQEKICGIVHDDNCRILGGVAGHAGLFGTVNGILSLSEVIEKVYNNQYTHPSFRNKELQKVLLKQKKTTWTLGFDTPSPTGSSSGSYFSKNTVGHLGFTGTSFWIDLLQKIRIVFLSNRTFFGIENAKIKQIRPHVHDIIMKEIIRIKNSIT
jgi:serine-type D-Ala-D-Ala carboxypeptidase